MTARPNISFEFFPPKTPQGKEKLISVRDTLREFSPDYFSVTYGAGGSTRHTTREIVLRINSDGLSVAPHLSFGGDSEADVLALLQDYKDNGIKKVVALRGDLPSGMGINRLVYANELVAIIRNNFGDHFEIMVAAYPEVHPQAENYARDIYWLNQKFAAGANSAITQYFFNPDAYFYFLEQCRNAGIERPIVPGIMPITNYENLLRFSDNCGAEIPRWIRQRLQTLASDPEGLKEFGAEVITRLCERLLQGGAPGLHFYTMNQAEPIVTILKNLNL